MARYVIGDVQGCWDSLEALVAQMPIQRRDRLWFVGDLVNRGPKSLKTLRRLAAAGNRIISVLGNHDLHLLALAAGLRKPQALDTVNEVLRARDAGALIDWLRRRPLAHADEDTLLVHAGVLPHWSLRQTLSIAQEISSRLKSRHWQDFLAEMIQGGRPHWADGIRGQQRLRAGLNAFTRLRYLSLQGVPDFSNKLAPEQKGLIPWFDFPSRKTATTRIVFGHWSTLGLIVRPRLISLDTGCVWGRQLSGIRLEDQRVFVQSSREQPAAEG